MPHPLMPRDLIRLKPKIQLLHLAQSKPVQVDPGAIHTLESCVEILFGFSGPLDQGDVGEGGEFASAGRVGVTGRTRTE